MALTKLNFSGQPTLPSSIFPTGSVIQTVQTRLSDTKQGISPTTFEDVPDFTVSITPQSTSSNILVSVSLSWGCVSNPYGAVKIIRDSTELDIGTQTGTSHTQATFALQGVDNEYRLMCDTFQLLDTSISTTSQVTYKLQWRSNVNLYLNKPYNLQTATNANVTTGVSTFTAQEIAG
jgi:hypothetical protein